MSDRKLNAVGYAELNRLREANTAYANILRSLIELEDSGLMEASRLKCQLNKARDLIGW